MMNISDWSRAFMLLLLKPLKNTKNLKEKNCKLMRANAMEEENSAYKRLQVPGRKTKDGWPGRVFDTWDTQPLDPWPNLSLPHPPHDLTNHYHLRNETMPEKWQHPASSNAKGSLLPKPCLEAPKWNASPSTEGSQPPSSASLLGTERQLRMARHLRKASNINEKHQDQQKEPETDNARNQWKFQNILYEFPSGSAGWGFGIVTVMQAWSLARKLPHATGTAKNVCVCVCVYYKGIASDIRQDFVCMTKGENAIKMEWSGKKAILENRNMIARNMI